MPRGVGQPLVPISRLLQSPVNVSRVLTLRFAFEGLGWGRSGIEVSLPVANRRYSRLPVGATPLAATADTNVRNIRASGQGSPED